MMGKSLGDSDSKTSLMQIALVWSFLRDLFAEKTRTHSDRWATPKKTEH
jgi:hypothetical protein